MNKLTNKQKSAFDDREVLDEREYDVRVDDTRPPSGQLYSELPDQSPVELPPPTLPGPLSSIGKLDQTHNTRFVPSSNPEVVSAESPPVPFDTIYNDFDLKVFPFYNFWTPDELTNDRTPRGQRKLEEIPRFMKLSWIPAPDSPSDILGPADVTRLSNRPVAFGIEAQIPKSFAVKGIGFTPAHLQPSKFSQVTQNIANGFIEPGVVSAIVDLPLHNAGGNHGSQIGVASSEMVDEDAFLTHPDLDGVSAHELQGQVIELKNGALGAGRLMNGDVSADSARAHDALVAGKYAVVRPTFGGENVQLHGDLSVSSRTATSTEAEKFDPVLDMIQKVQRAPISNDVETSAQVKVKFTNPAIGGAVSQDKINLMTRPEHAETMMGIAQNLHRLEVLDKSGFRNLERNTDIPSFPAAPGLKPVEYAGYTIQKYRRSESGVFQLVEVIDLPSRDYDSYIDTKVAYGEVYRYRIRSYIRWTRSLDVDLFGKSKVLFSQNGSQTLPLSPFQSSYFASEWSKLWAYGTIMDMEAPPAPDELQVKADSARRRIIVTFRLPYNPQRDICKMRLFRKIQDTDGKDLTDWVQVREASGDNPAEAVDFSPRNVIYFDTDVNFGFRYVYTAQSISRHGEQSTYSEQLSAELREDWKVFGEKDTRFVSCAGVRPEYFGAFSVYPHRKIKTEIVADDPKIDGHHTKRFKVTIEGRLRLGNTLMNDAKYMLRFESLDTGQKFDSPLSIKYVLNPPRVRDANTNGYVPSHSLEAQDEFQRAQDATLDNSNGGHKSSFGAPAAPLDRPDRGSRN